MRVLFISIMLISFSQITKGQVSDYKTVESFRDSVELLKHQVSMALTIEQIDYLDIDFQNFLSKYENYKEVINHSIYPDTYENITSHLSELIVSNGHRIYTIDSQREQIMLQSNQISAYRSEVNRLYNKTDSLYNEILTSQANEQRLSDLVRDYRIELEKRDRTMIAILDSLLKNKNDWSLDFQESQLIFQNFQLDEFDNPLSLIEFLLDENLRNFEESAMFMNVEDHIRSASYQNQFEETLDKTLGQLARSYENDQNWIPRIETKMEQWKELVHDNLWASVNNFVDYKGLDISSFNNSESFYNALDQLITTEIQISEDEIFSTESYERYEILSEFWLNTLKPEWVNNTEHKILLSSLQIYTIDDKLNRWEESARPFSSMLLSMFILMMVSIGGFVLVLLKAKSS